MSADRDPMDGEARGSSSQTGEPAATGLPSPPVVGLGGAASSIGAIRTFLRALPHDSGMALLVTVHSYPGRELRLTELLRPETRMEVIELDGSARIEADHVYVIPPGKALQVVDGRLQAVETKPPRGRQVAIDLFFRALADSHGSHAAAVVLSGQDGDGAVGIKRIKERGGLTVAQDPDEAESGGMPRSAIATGMVDWVLPVAEMPARLIEYQRLEGRLALPPERPPALAEAPEAEGSEAALQEVLRFLRSRTGRDFSCYKRATVVRRIARRMQVNRVADLSAYLDCLRTSAGEAGALLQDLLISVTNFFRDPSCFAALEALIPTLFKGKGPADTVRVWVPACATGEEAYSIAMLLAEHIAALEQPPTVQIFATDLDESSIQSARHGIYPETIEADVTPERLRRFFVREHLGYRVRREMRESVLFAVHDLLKDSPFSRLDLMSCRNLLIYLTREAQERALDLFHFALRPQGLLFLGSAESIDEGSPQFDVLDAKCRLYRQHPSVRHSFPLPTGPGTLALKIADAARSPSTAEDAGRSFAGAAANDATRAPARPLPGPRARHDGSAASWATLHYRLLERVAPPSLIVDAEHDIVHLSESAGRFLQLVGGEPTRNLLRLVDPALRIELRAALYQAQQSDATAGFGPVALEVEGSPCAVKVQVTPGGNFAPDHSLVVFEVQTEAPETAPGAPPPQPHPIADHHLEREVERLKARLRETVEQYEASTEELKAGNEELQAMNEELRSATEELETGREELQSVNEELSAVNAELKSKVEELGSANSDMLNLMDATAIPTLFLDRDLLIMRYTPAAMDLFNLIPADIGRPLSDLRTELDYPQLADDAQSVLRRLVPVEREIARAGGDWFLARLLPYRTPDDRIGGVVLTLVDVTERRRTEQALRSGEERLRLIFENAREYAIFSMDTERRVNAWNIGAERILGWREAEVLGQAADIIFTPEDVAERVPEREAETALATGRAADDRFQRRKDGSRFWASGVMTAMRDAAGQTLGFVKILRDQSEARRAHETLERSQAELLAVSQESERARREAELQKGHLEALFSEAPAPICIVRGSEHVIEFANPHMCQLWGERCEAVIGRPLFEAVPEASSHVFKDLLDGVLGTGVPYLGKEVPARFDRHGNGQLEDVYLNFTYAPLHGIDAAIDGVMIMAADVTDEVRARQQMSELHEAAQAAGRAKDDFLAMLGHELRNPLAPLHTSLQLLKQRLADGGVDDLLGVMERQANNLARIVDDLLDASRISEGKIELRPEVVDFSTSVSQAVHAAKPFLEAREHRVSVTLPKRALMVTGDPVRIEQIILNLLNNAGKYTPVGGHIQITLRRAGEWAELSIADDGVGIADDLRPRLFQLFQQGNRDLSRGEGGLGIGLNVVRRLVELHHGTVEAHSAGTGQGSEFVVRLPLLRASKLHPPVVPARPQAAGPLRVLVVDDNRDAGETLVMLLESLGHRTRLALAGHEALEICDEWRPQVVFLDIGLPGMDGFEVASELRRRPLDPRPRLVAVTGYGQDSDRAKSLRAGFDDHLVKPAAFSAIEAIVSAAPSAQAASESSEQEAPSAE